MKYGDELDRIPGETLSRRQFLSAGSQRAARLAAGVLLPDGGKRVVDESTEAVDESTGEVSRDQSGELPDRREG